MAKSYAKRLIYLVRQNPRFSLILLLVFSLPFERIPSIDILGGQVTLKINQLLAIILIGYSIPLFWSLRGKLMRSPYPWLALFLFSCVLSGLMALDMGAAARVLSATGLVMMAAVAIGITAMDDRRLVLLEKALYATTWLTLSIGLYQYLGDTFGLSPRLTGLATNYVKEVFGFPRIQGTSIEPLFYASFLLIPFCILSARYLLTGRTKRGLLFSITVAIVLAVSRGAFIGAILAILFLLTTQLFLKASSFKRSLLYVGLIVCGIVFALALTITSSIPANHSGRSGQEKYTATSKTTRLAEQSLNFVSQDDRSRNRTLAIRAFKKHPLLGIGPGNFDWYAKEAYHGYRGTPRVVVNNEPLELLAETGMVGTLLLGMFSLSLLAMFVRRLTSLRGKGLNRADTWAVALVAYLAATFMQFQTFSTLYIMHVWVVIGILLAILSTSRTAEK